MENNKMENNNEKNSHKRSWLERNLWIVALCVVIFLLHMCKSLAR